MVRSNWIDSSILLVFIFINQGRIKNIPLCHIRILKVIGCYHQLHSHETILALVQRICHIVHHILVLPSLRSVWANSSKVFFSLPLLDTWCGSVEAFRRAPDKDRDKWKVCVHSPSPPLVEELCIFSMHLQPDLCSRLSYFSTQGHKVTSLSWGVLQVACDLKDAGSTETMLKQIHRVQQILSTHPTHGHMKDGH